MDANSFLRSYLTKDDFDTIGKSLRIERVTEESVGDGKDQKQKLVVYTEQYKTRGIVLNSTNLKMLLQICGSSDTEHWVGRWIHVYKDPNVSMRGQIVGGLRIRKLSDEELSVLDGETPFH